MNSRRDLQLVLTSFFVAFQMSADAVFANSVEEKAFESGCVDTPVLVEGSMYRCTVPSGAAAYFNMAPTSGNAAPRKAAPPAIKLLCRAIANGSSYVVNLAVDYKENTVNGFKATITDDMIVWFSQEPLAQSSTPARHRHEINRLSGTYSVQTLAKGALVGPSPTYECGKAPPPRF